MSVLTAVDEADALEQLHRLGLHRRPAGRHPDAGAGRAHGARGGRRPDDEPRRDGPARRGDDDREGRRSTPSWPAASPTTCRSSSPRCGRCCAPSTTCPRRRARRTRPRRSSSSAARWPRRAGSPAGSARSGPGHRANASIGRAVRLCLMNIGGARPGVSDMALLGHPGKFTMCLTENVDESPWEPCSVAAGFDPLDSVVTVDRRRGAALGRVRRRRRRPRLAAAAAAGRGPGDRQPRLEQRVLPDRFGRRRPQPRARRRARPGRARAGPTCSASCTGWRRTGAASCASSTRRSPGPATPTTSSPTLPSPDHVLVLVAGGGGLYSSVFPSWSAGAHANPILHERIETDQACAIPGLG